MSVPLYQSGGSGSSLATPVSLANGGTHADLSATGGASQVLKQASAGADVTVGQLAFTDVSGVATPAQMPILTAVDQGYLFSNGTINAGVSVSGAQILVSNANETWVVQFVIPCAVTIGKVTYKSGVTTVAATHASFGIYDSTGALKGQGTFSTAANASTTQTATFTRVTLVPGVYYFAWTCDNATINTTYTLFLANTTVIDLLNFATTAKRVGKGTASAAGVLNGTMGAITASAVPNQSIPACIFEYN